MQFIVPQFIDVENKIIGPISTRQFIIIIVSVGICFLAYKLMTLFAFIIVTVFVLGIGAVFAFVKINGQQFHYFALNIVQTLKKPRLRVWSKFLGKEAQAPEIQMKIMQQQKRVSSSRLTEISLMAATGGNIHLGKDENKNN